MELSLVVQTGDDAGRRIPVPPGAPVRVGRQPPSEVRISDDPMLSNLHFSVECGAGGGYVRDLGSRFGILLNGHKVVEAALKNGDEIKAGRTIFSVSLSGTAAGSSPDSAPPAVAEPPARSARDTVLVRPGTLLSPDPPPAGPVNPVHDRLLALFRSQAVPLFAILDAARESTLVERMKASGLPHESLYDGEKGQELAPFGPWLVQLPYGAAALGELVRDGWGKSWGVYLTCDLGMAEVRRHLRKFLVAKLPDGRQVFFRYYDPRVLRTYLPTCMPDEMASFFGPIRRYFVEGPDGTEVLEFAGSYKDWRKVGLAAGA
jgi:pSer/pThr/pTyr-binding forkhead associated (FHA) protein